MRIEAFSRGKHHTRPEDNEDALVVLPGLAYAVLDGVTDRSGRLFGEARAGRFASGLVARHLVQALLAEEPSRLGAPAGPAVLVEDLSAGLREGYAAHGHLAEATAAPGSRAGCTLALAVIEGDELHLLAVGDSGIRVGRADGTADVLVEAKPLDLVTALMRRETWRLCDAAGLAARERDAVCEAATWKGLAAPPAALGERGAGLRARVLDACAAALPGLDPAEIAAIVDSGIDGQRRFANHPGLALAYGVIDGFAVPDRHRRVARYPLAEVRTVELFSDGYFAPPDAFGVEAWEAAFRRVEREDPHKVEAYPSTKGSTAAAWTDDRTYLGVAF